MTAVKKRSKSRSADNTENLSFEEALAALEGIIRELEGDDLTLERSLKRFEEGVRLTRLCDGHLSNARGKLTELIRGEDGKLIREILGDNLEMFTGGDKGEGDG